MNNILEQKQTHDKKFANFQEFSGGQSSRKKNDFRDFTAQK